MPVSVCGRTRNRCWCTKGGSSGGDGGSGGGDGDGGSSSDDGDGCNGVPLAMLPK